MAALFGCGGVGGCGGPAVVVFQVKADGKGKGAADQKIDASVT